MKRFFGNKTTVHQKILLFFSFLILLAIGVNVIFLHQINMFLEILHNTSSSHADLNLPAESGMHAILAKFQQQLRLSIVLGFLALLSGLILCMFFLDRAIAGPLRKLEQLTRKMAEGYLDQLTPSGTHPDDPIGKIGENVQELAINLQELLLITWNMSEQDLILLNRIQTLIEQENEMPSHDNILKCLLIIQRHRERARDFIGQFELYQVSIDGNKAVSQTEYQA